MYKHYFRRGTEKLNTRWIQEDLESMYKTMEMMLNKKQIQAVFLFEFKMGHKAAETTHNINNTFGPGTANELQCSRSSRNFAKDMRALKMRSIAAGRWKLMMTS
nr:histone-lysine N-methyltransferase SETMAR-like [Columba livia]